MDSTQQRRADVIESLRAFASTDTELGRLFARRHRMHQTDAAAIVEILTAEQHGRMLTPARLAERVGLTAGATSTLVNRLEAAGHIARSRDHSDRRIVGLHSTKAIHDDAAAFFAPLAGHLDEVLQQYSPEQLDLVLRVVASLRFSVSEIASIIPD